MKIKRPIKFGAIFRNLNSGAILINTKHHLWEWSYDSLSIDFYLFLSEVLVLSYQTFLIRFLCDSYSANWRFKSFFVILWALPSLILSLSILFCRYISLFSFSIALFLYFLIYVKPSPFRWRIVLICCIMAFFSKWCGSS